MRVNASTQTPIAGQLRHGTAVSVQCQLGGENVAGLGTVRTTWIWDRLSNGRATATASSA